MKRFRNPFDIARVMKVKNMKWEELEFSGDAIKVFLFVFINMSNERLLLLIELFKSEEVVKSEISTVFARTISSNRVIKYIKAFKSSTEMGTDN
jgi:hypothetical protein